jgi:hypothetical protein
MPNSVAKSIMQSPLQCQESSNDALMFNMIKIVAGVPVRIFSALLWLIPASILMFRYSKGDLVEAQYFLACASLYLTGGCLFVLSMQYRIFLKDHPEVTSTDTRKEIH